MPPFHPCSHFTPGSGCPPAAEGAQAQPSCHIGRPQLEVPVNGREGVVGAEWQGVMWG